MSGVKGRSGRRISSVTTLDNLVSHARTVSLRAIKDESIPLVDRARLATQFPLKEMAERSEQVVVNLNLSDELMRRIMARLAMHDASALPEPNDIYIQPVIEPNDPQPNEPNDASTTITPSPDPSTPA